MNAFAAFGARLLQALPPEVAHDAAVRAIAFGAAGGDGPEPLGRAETRTRFCGFDLAHPLGMAAGFDKSARCHRGLARLGFAFVEVGAVTPRPQAGNPKPRLFRLPQDRALVNRFGFNNDGMEAVALRLARADRAARLGPLGVNLGANKDAADRSADFAAVYRTLAPHADFATINVSSPNTPGLRELQATGALRDILDRIAAVDLGDDPRPPIFVKFSPDGADEDFADQIDFIAGRDDVSGLVLTNTTTARSAALESVGAAQTGGLSGAPLRERALERLRQARARLRGSKTLIGVGGVMTAEDAYERILAGADLLQIYTAFVLDGPAVVAAMVGGLAERLRADGFRSLRQAVGGAA